jgi:uncharacterized protein (TIGR00251 family)
MQTWLKNHIKGSLLLLHIQPGSSVRRVDRIHGDRLKIKIQGEAKDGEANEDLIEFLSESLGIAKGKIHLIRGESSRQKDILVELSPEEVILKLKLSE